MPGYCDISKVPWREKPEALGMARLTRVESAEEAKLRKLRSYVLLEQRYADQDKDGVDDFAMVVTHHFAPTREGTLHEWAELSTLIVRDCTVRNVAVLIISSGQRPKNELP